MDDQPWYREAIIYEVHIRSFFDSDGDGIGDIVGLTRRLDYIQELGVTALWLLPFYPSPLKDDGYDIASYREIHPDYGTLNDFQNFLGEAHRRGLKVISELVINHTSDQHPWFQRARRAPRGSIERDFYVWSDTPDRYRQARVLFPEVKDSNWTFDAVAGQYYWHRFYAHQPDLNFDNPEVRRAIFDVVDFWLDMGIDGLRLDAITYLYEREGTNCESLPETHAFLRELRAHIDAHFDDRMLLAEANQWPEDAVDYFGDGDECHMAFHFPIMPRLFMAVEMEDRLPIIDILEQTPDLPEDCQWALFLRNHDELTLEMVTDEERDFMYRTFAPELRMRINLGIRRRLAPLLRDDRRKMRLLYALLFSLPGTPILYYGDEIGMGDNYHLGDRNGVRTPMQWSADRNAGFSRANPQSLFLPVVTDPTYHYLSTNVENQENNPSSLLRWIKRLLALRREYPSLGTGSLRVVPCTNHRVLAFARSCEDQTILVVINLAQSAQHLNLDLSEFAGRWPVEIWGHSKFPPITEDDAHHYSLSLGPYGFYWFRLDKAPAAKPAPPPREAPDSGLEVHQDWTEVFEGRVRPHFERHLSAYLSQQPWFNPRIRPIDSLEISERTRLRWEGGPTVITLVEARFYDGDSELYVLPLEFRSQSVRGEGRPRSQAAIIAPLQIEQANEMGYLYDATANPVFATALMSFIRRQWKLEGLEGTIRGHWLGQFANIDPEEIDALSANFTERAYSHTSLIFGRRLVMRLFRRLERGSLDVEMGTYLLEYDFDGAASLMGHLDYHRGRWEPTTLVTIHEYIPHRSDGWSWFQEWAQNYYGQVHRDLQSPSSPPRSEVPPLGSLDLMRADPSRLLCNPDFDDFLAGARQLGQRTASLHRVLGAAEAETPFEPLPLNTAYERARYQAMRSLLARAYRLLRARLSKMGDSYDLARWVLEHDREVLTRFQALVGRGVRGQRLRIHGDFHLEEVLRTDDDFIIIDFAGHPWLPIGERRIKRSPLRDVASMMRSFHLASLMTMKRYCERHHLGKDHPCRTILFHHAQRLYGATSSALLEGYLEERQTMAFLPPEEEAVSTLLDALRLKKAIHQLRNELEREVDPTMALIGVATMLDT